MKNDNENKYDDQLETEKVSWQLLMTIPLYQKQFQLQRLGHIIVIIIIIVIIVDENKPPSKITENKI